MSLTLLSSPLQGFTDYRFRTAFQKHFAGIDTFYAPYFRLNGVHEMKSSNIKDILPENNATTHVIPQVMCKDAVDFLTVAKFVQSLGYKELNWNLGCPYSMVTKRGMGAGLIKQKDLILSILNTVKAESDIVVSLKMRLGNDNPSEIEQLLPLLDVYPIKYIAIHPRLGKQQYKGTVDLESFEQCLKLSAHKIIYNGDIDSVAKFRYMQERFPTLDTWMLGRGIIQDPFLPGMIKHNSLVYPENANKQFSAFHDALMAEYALVLSGDKHLLLKMYHFWEYFSLLFSNSHKCLKKIKKAQHMRTYEAAVVDILRNEEIIGLG